MSKVQSAALLVFAALCEIAARYLAWQSYAQARTIAAIAASAAMLISLFAPVLQGGQFQFGRSTAAYGVLFVVLTLLWSWKVDRKAPDFLDLLGAGLCIIGIAIIMYSPRSG